MRNDRRFRDIMTRVFSERGDLAVYNVNHTDTTLDNHNVFNKLFVIDVSSDEIEVPVFAKSVVEVEIRNKLQLPHIIPTSKIVIPMYVNTYNRSRRTANNIVKDFFSEVDFNRRLQKITTTRGNIYYGGKGIILDKDFNILLLCTIICRKIEYGNEHMMSYYKPIVHVSPQVFLKSSDLVNRFILSEIIPFYISHSIDTINTLTYCRSDIPKGTKPQILIDDVNKFIENPIKPTPQKCSDSVLNQILIDNIEDVLNQLYP